MRVFIDSTLLLFVLLNPFLMSIYLLDLIQALDAATFRRALIRGTMIAAVAFALFAVAGDTFFRNVLQVRFASFLVFGGIVFLLVALRFMLAGTEAIRDLRGPPDRAAASIAMPFMIGPGTVSASVMAGTRLPVEQALLAILLAISLMLASIFALKWLHDTVRRRHERLVERYIDIAGRASGLVIGTIAVDMLFNGLGLLWVEFNGG